jgi:flagellar basal body rod protein FlgG
MLLYRYFFYGIIIAYYILEKKMKSGIYSATAGMLTQLEKLNVTANNIANIGTTGYKADIPFEQVIRFLNEGPYPGKDQPVLGGTEINTSNGNLKITKRSLDLAFEGSGFFVVQGNGEKLYTRNGSFNINSKKELVTADGLNVLDKFDKKIKLFGKSHYFTPKGDLMVDGNYLTTLKVVDIKDRQSVKKVGNQFYKLNSGVKKPVQMKNPALAVGALERSNVELMTEMTNLITTQRAFEFQKRTLDTLLGQILRRTISELPRPI